MGVTIRISRLCFEHNLSNKEERMRKLAMVFLIVGMAFIFAAGASATPVQWTNGHWYEAVLVADGINWENARGIAALRGGYLATATSVEENGFIHSLVNDPRFWYIDVAGNTEGPWLGGFQLDGSGEPATGWQWVTNEPWSYTNWASGEPNNNGGTENRTVFFGLGNYSYNPALTWNDVPLGALQKGYIVEWDANPVPIPGAILLFAPGLAGLAVLRRKFKR
jgi:hypothetical protein